MPGGLTKEEVRAILAHGWGGCTDVEPVTECEKSLYTVDELTGIIGACARMRPNGLTDLTVSSFMKKFKDKKFAAGCSRDVITQGADMLGVTVAELAEMTLNAMTAQ